MLLSFALFAALQSTAGQGSPTPPAPVPVLAQDPKVRSAIERAEHCVDDDGGAWIPAERAVADLDAPAGSAKWEAARVVVARYVREREAARQCINDLEKIRYSSVMSEDDRIVLTTMERGLLEFWLEQSDREAGVLARLVGIKTSPTKYPSYVPMYKSEQNKTKP